MPLELRGVTKEHLRALFNLKVRDDQQGLVAPNEITLAQAAHEGEGIYVWGLWDGGTLVGLMALIHPGEYDDLDEGDDPEAACVWRLVIGADHQGKGYGVAALEAASQQARAWGLPKIVLTVVDRADSAMAFYEKAGFRRTGRIVEEEIELIRTL